MMTLVNVGLPYQFRKVKVIMIVTKNKILSKKKKDPFKNDINLITKINKRYNLVTITALEK